MTSHMVAQGQSIDTRNQLLSEVQDRVLWLAVNMVHHANQVRPNPDGLKVGGHQASSSSVVTILTSLYFDFMQPGDKIAIKPPPPLSSMPSSICWATSSPNTSRGSETCTASKPTPAAPRTPTTWTHHRLGGLGRGSSQFRRLGGRLP